MSLPVFYINLARDAKRRHKIEAELARQGLKGTRFEAVWWADLDAAEQDRLYSGALNARQYHVALVNGEKGCYASHLRLWQQLLASDAPAMVVLEDDVVLKDGFAALLEAIGQSPQPWPWDMVKLIGRERDTFRGRSRLGQGAELVDYRRVPSLTAGYVISRQGAHKLCQSRQPFGRPIDVDLRYWWENDLRVLGMAPAALALDETSLTSSIAGRSADPRAGQRWKKFRRQLVYSALNAWHSARRGALLK